MQKLCFARFDMTIFNPEAGLQMKKVSDVTAFSG